MPVLDCFPTPVWSTQAPNRDKVNKELMELVHKLRTNTGNTLSKSNAGGWHSDMLDINTLPELRKCIFGFLEEIKGDLNIKPDTDISVESLWININSKHNYNRTHTHPNSMISGVYYAVVPDGSGELALVDPRPLAPFIKLPVTESNKYTAEEVRHFPQPGTLTAFPSWLAHYVEANLTDEERISVAFNIALASRQQ